MPNALINFLRRPFRDWWLLLEAAGALCTARLQLIFRPFSQIAPQLGVAQTETSHDSSAGDLAVSRRISWAVDAVARHAPLPFVCLPRAMAAQQLLARRGVPSTLYLGVQLKQGEPQPLSAHAWLRMGPRLVTGRESRPAFAPVAAFACHKTSRSAAAAWSRRALLGVGLALLAVASLIPQPPLKMVSWRSFPVALQPALQWLGLQDFAANLLAVGTVNLVVFTLVFGVRRNVPTHRLRLMGLMAALVVALECSQLAQAERSFDPWDMVAGFTAILATSWPWMRFRRL